MKKIILVALLLTGCTTTDTGKKTVDFAAVQQYAMIACALTPTVEQIAAIYATDETLDKPQKTAALICALLTATPQIQVPAK